MLLGSLLAAGLLAAAVSNPAPPGPSSNLHNNAVFVSASAAAPTIESRRPAVGEQAPDFSYQSADQLWQNLHNVLEQGHVLLVFGATDAELRSLERERESLLARGVVPMVVVEKHDLDAWAIVRRLSLTYSLLADPHGAIGEQYGVLDESVGRSAPAWFVIDSTGHVREAVSGGLPASGWTATAAAALGIDRGTRAASAD